MPSLKSTIVAAFCALTAACHTAESDTPHSVAGDEARLIRNVGFEHESDATNAFYNTARQNRDWGMKENPTSMNDGQAVISSEAAASGARSMKVTYSANVQEVKQALWPLPPQQAYRLDYAVKFHEDFVFNGQGGLNGGKLPGLAGRGTQGQFCSGGLSCLNGGGFSARLMWRTDGEAVLYLYDVTQSRTDRKYGIDFAFEGNAKFEPGRWHSIRQEIVLNRPGQADGSLRLWMDGRPAVHITGREIVASGEAIDTLAFSTFFGGNAIEWFPASDQIAYFDDFQIREMTPQP